MLLDAFPSAVDFVLNYPSDASVLLNALGRVSSTQRHLFERSPQSKLNITL